jgi:UDP-glucose 4-epimerase
MSSFSNQTRKRILLTGGSGTLGYNILRRLANDERYFVTALLRNPGSCPVAEFSQSVEFIKHDLSDTIHTAQIFERVSPAIIVHCAASGLRPLKESWFDLMAFNVETTMRLFQMNCRLDHPSHFVYISTGLVYREQLRPLKEIDPIETIHPYGASKAAADALLQSAAAEFDRTLTILRPFAFTGVHDGGNRIFPLILRAAEEHRELGLTTGTQIRDFCAVEDIVDAVIRVIERQPELLVEKYNLGSGISAPLRTTIESICEELGLDVKLDFGRVTMNPYEPCNLVADITHAWDKLKWKPQTRLAYAVWSLAKDITPSLILRTPKRFYDGV